MKILNYIIYGLIFVIVCIGIYIVAKPSNTSVALKTLVVSDTNINLKVGQKRQINAYVINDDYAKINYESLDDRIVSVDSNGFVKALKSGQAVIVINYQDERGIQNSKCKVFVESNIEAIKFYGDNLIISVGESYSLDYQLEPNEASEDVSFAVGDSQVVLVDSDGVITGVREGSSTVRVSAGDINNEITVYVVKGKVNNHYATLPSSIIASDMEMYVSEEAEIELDLTPQNSDKSLLKFTSSNEAIASVDEMGKIKGLREGKCIITIESVNGIRKDISVDIKTKKVLISNINITSDTNLSLKVGDTSQITYTVEPSDATDKTVSFVSSDSTILSVSSSGLIKALKKGEAEVVVLSVESGVRKTIKVSVKSDSSGGSSGGSSSGGNCSYVSPRGKSGVNRSCDLQNSQDTNFNKCFKSSPGLGFSVSSITMNVGETRTVHVTIPLCGGSLVEVTRISPSGDSGWSEYVSQCYTNLSGNSFDWTITAKKRDSLMNVTLTVQLDVKAPSGLCTGNIKSMGGIKLTIK